MSTTHTKKDYLLDVLVRILHLKKQIRYKYQIKDVLHAYTKRDIKIIIIFKKYFYFEINEEKNECFKNQVILYYR